MKRIVASMLGFVMLLVSCGQDPQPDTTKPVVTLVSSKASVTAAQSIKLTATATDNVGVTKVEFYEGAIKLGEDSSSPYEFDVALTVANNGSRSYKAKAFDAAGNEGSSDAVVVTVAIAQTITVTGTVINGRGARVTGAQVLLNNGNLQTTDANGSFTYNSVAVPYNLTVTYVAEAGSFPGGVQVFVSNGLTRSDPLFVSPLATSRASLSGMVTGPTYPLPAGDKIAIGSTGGIQSFSENVENSGQFAADIIWSPISATTTVDLAALRYTSVTSSGGSTEVITDFIKMGKRTGIALTKGSNQSFFDIALDTPVTVSNATLTYSLGAYANTNQGQFTTGLSSVTSGGAQFTLRIPMSNGSTTKIPSEGAGFSVSGVDSSGNAADIVAPAVVDGLTTINLSNTIVVSNTAPIPNAVNVSTTPTLTWNSLPGATAYFVRLGDLSRNYIIYLPGTSSSYTIPDFAAVNAGLQLGTRYQWQVFGIKSANVTSDTLTEPSQNTVFNLSRGLFESEVYTSGITAFTTAP